MKHVDFSFCELITRSVGEHWNCLGHVCVGGGGKVHFTILRLKNKDIPPAPVSKSKTKQNSKLCCNSTLYINQTKR